MSWKVLISLAVEDCCKGLLKMRHYFSKLKALGKYTTGTLKSILKSLFIAQDEDQKEQSLGRSLGERASKVSKSVTTNCSVNLRW